MKCYIHHNVDAVGICKNCQKGICPDCATDVGDGLACKNTCVEKVKSLNEVIQRSKGVYKKTGATYFRLAFIYGLLALFFIIFGLFFQPMLASFTVPLGIIFLIATAFMIYSGIKIKSKDV